MNVMGYLQRLGKALMLPIATLPVAGLLLRLGQPDVFGMPFIEAAGSAIFSHMPILFAAAIAAGLSKNTDAAAAIAGMVGYYILTEALQVLNPELNLGVFGGVIVGVLAGELFNKYHNIRLPEFLGFFGGKRFVPIVTGVCALLLAVLMSVIWPPISAGIDAFSYWMLDSEIGGKFGYGFINRMLIPVGLHHIINSIVWTVMGEYNGVTGEMLRFAAGDPSAGLMLSGFYPILMFALPASCLAIYHSARKENRPAVGGMLLSIAFTAFLTGITEPIEYTFMFLAPVLYFIHAVLTGVSLVIAAALDIHMSFGFSAGLIDYVLFFNAPSAKNAWMLVPLGLAFSLAYYSLFMLAIRLFDIQTPGREDTTMVMANSDVDSSQLAHDYIKALGGKTNLTHIDACITRLRLTVNDKNIIDEPQLKALGAKAVVHVGDKNLQVILGPMAEIVAGEMKTIHT
ncbi:N-acetylglucosamine-specific PTS transporter subunit IIBC [Enterovibrio calviensis]|uniref:N-acetylglucosamine-specific PTS transporter subunit IIBC n=1 Tax=Enterovibrio calviensis TaxID=91359 RepID=UPI000486C38F|nr:N-acetylglucosamine-specific PTS transporter subunit IIBC [Enterovibrio calviensis]